MSEYILFRPSGSIGPDFNKAADLLKQHPDIKIKDSMTSSMASGFLIDAHEQKIDLLRKQLNGWNIFPNFPMSAL